MTAHGQEVHTPLDELYAACRPMDCKGLCATHCSGVGAFDRERQRMVERGITPPQEKDVPCRHLNLRGRCRIYDDRPLICRLFGAVPFMRCPYGCTPSMTDREGRELLRAVSETSQALDLDYVKRLQERIQVRRALGR